MDDGQYLWGSMRDGAVSSSLDQSAFGFPPVHAFHWSAPTKATSPNLGLTGLNTVLVVPVLVLPPGCWFPELCPLPEPCSDWLPSPPLDVWLEEESSRSGKATMVAAVNPGSSGSCPGWLALTPDMVLLVGSLGALLAQLFELFYFLGG